jgi:hypothetical protein
MNRYNGYTTVEQSKKLAEILPVESADMYYTSTMYGEQMRITYTVWEVHLGLDIAIKENLFSHRNGYTVPCWSLAALLGVLKEFGPETMFLKNTSDGRGTRLTNVWRLSVDPIDADINLRDIYADNLVDACYAMIIKLHEQNLL